MHTDKKGEKNKQTMVYNTLHGEAGTHFR